MDKFILNDIRVNNSVFDGQVEKVPFGPVTVNWNFSPANETIRQQAYEIRVGTSLVNWGNNNYQPDTFRRPMLDSQAGSWTLPTKFMTRGTTYYGQLRVRDTENSESPWTQFSFQVNRVPFVTGVSLSPSAPTESDDLSLSFVLNNESTRSRIRWFRDGIHLTQFDDFEAISTEFLVAGETWRAEITPFDDVERGGTVSTDSVTVTKLAPAITGAQILPLRPTVDDMLEASYTVTDPNTNTEIRNDDSQIRWYINEGLIEEANDSRFVRFVLKAGDQVRFTVLPTDGTFEGQMISSESVTIQSADFRILNLRVEGNKDNISLSSPNPVIEWDLIEPFGKVARYAKIAIGTAPFSNNIFETIVQDFDERFVVPDNIVRRGGDYFATIYVSDTNDNFTKGETVKFRIDGSLWESDVSNVTGWTLEVSPRVSGADSFTNSSGLRSGSQDETLSGGDNFQRLSLSDGTRFAEIRFYENAVQLLPGGGKVITRILANTETFVRYQSIVVVGQDDDIKVYFNNDLVIDGTDLWQQISDDKFIELGSGAGSDAVGEYKYVRYNLDGSFEPGIDDEYANFFFEPIIEFEDSIVSSIYGSQGNLIASVNPSDEDQSGRLYQIIEDAQPELVETRSVEQFDFSVNSSSLSLNDKYAVFSHTTGATVFESYFIPKYDESIIFGAGVDPVRSGWELVQSIPFTAATFSRDGLIIDTTFSNTARLDSRPQLDRYEVVGIRVEWDAPAALGDGIFFIAIEGTGGNRKLNFYLINGDTGEVGALFVSFNLGDKTIGDLVREINDANIAVFATYGQLSAVNNTEHNPATSLDNITPTLLSNEGLNLKGTFSVVNPYAINPYSYVAGGKWFYTQRNHGSPWYDKVRNDDGWTIDIEMTIEQIEDSDLPSESEGPEGVGLYINDGVFYETINFYTQEIILAESDVHVAYDTTSFTRYRVTGKNNQIRVYAKKDTDPDFVLIGESPFGAASSAAGNAGRPRVFIDSDGVIHATWHDDGRKNRQIYYSKWSSASGWTRPQLVVKEDFDAMNPDICVDSNGQIFIVFETRKADYTDIACVIGTSLSFSEPFFISADLYESKSPVIAVDDQDNVHVAWEDHRDISPEIYYVVRGGDTGEWNATRFGGSDTRISLSENGASDPSIHANGFFVYISWTEHKRNGNSSIKLSTLNRTTKTWQASGQQGIDYTASSVSANKPSHSDVCTDLQGQVFVLWHDVVGDNYQIFARVISPSFAQSQSVAQLTTGLFDSRYPSSGVDASTGNVYVAFEKSREEFFDPYNPYFDQTPQVARKNAQVYVLRYNSNISGWESSNQSKTVLDSTFGGFDAQLFIDQYNTSARPAIAKSFSGSEQAHILYEYQAGVDSNEFLLNRDKFSTIRDGYFALSFDNTINLSEYNDNDLQVSTLRLRKEIRFGDFSASIGTRMSVKSIKYYLHDAVDPFKIRLLSASTIGLPRLDVRSSIVNTKGDVWLGTEESMYFYDLSENSLTVLDDDSDRILHGIEEEEIVDFKSDKAGNFYVLTPSKLFVSSDHIYYFNVTLPDSVSLPNDMATFDIDDQQNVYIGSSTSGITVVAMREAVAQLSVDSENHDDATRSIEADSVVTLTSSDGLSSDEITVVRIDDNRIVWIGTRDSGITRYSNGSYTTFNTTNGLTSNFINDIGIRNTAIRYIATALGITKMVGSHLEKLDFDNINAPIASVDNTEPGDLVIPSFFNATAILWRDPNILFVASGDNIFQITFLDENFTREQTQITKFNSRDFALLQQVSDANDGLQLYELVGNSISLTDDVVYEVLLNGNPLTTGFSAVASGNQLFFRYPLRFSDSVQVRIRHDLMLLNDFSQNAAEEALSGRSVTRLEKAVSDGDRIYVATEGDVNSVQINDSTTNLPFDKIILDTTPPQGKITIDEQIDQTLVRIKIEQLDDPSGIGKLPFDETSGIDSLIVSNFDNFTSDGETLQEPIPFVTDLTHDLGLAFTNASRIHQFEGTNEVGRSLVRYERPTTTSGGEATTVPTMYCGTGSPANVYRFNSITEEWDYKATLDEEHPNAEVHFLLDYNGLLIAGTGEDGGTAKVYVSSDGETFSLAGSLPGEHAHAAVIFEDLVYIGVSGSEGYVYSYDGTTFSEIFDQMASSVYDLTVANGKIIAATGDNGRVYSLDVDNLTQTIVHSDEEDQILSAQSTTVGGSPIVFVGTGSDAKILRYNLATAFIFSFRTVPAAVRAMEEVAGTIYAAIGSDLYQFDGNAWNIEFNHEFDIYDVAEGPDGNLFFISDDDIYRISAGVGVKNVYLKLIDRAGNETQLFVEDTTGGSEFVLDDNLFDSITLEDLISFTNRNKIIEVDSLGNTVFSYSGTDRFYSAEKVDEERGTYFSEIFNGSNGHIFWDRLDWDATVPDDTTLTISVRSGTTEDNVLDADFSIVVDGGSVSNADLQFLPGQYLQFKVEMTSSVRGLSPSLRRVIVKSVSADSTHFFTTNFVLPGRVKGGLLTSQKMLPVASDVVFGIDTNNKVDFSEYQIIDENRIFTTTEDQIGQNLRVGIRFITPSRSETFFSDLGEYGPYNTLLDLNAVEWTVFNESASSRTYFFRITFFTDAEMTNQVYQVDSKDFVGTSAPSGGGTDPVGWAFDGEQFPFEGASVDAGQSGLFSFAPVGENPLLCNTYYYVKIELLYLEDPSQPSSSDLWSELSSNTTFFEACGVTFVDRVDFDFSNDDPTDTFHYRIRFYSDEERTTLVGTVFSGNNQDGWFFDNEEFPSEGITVTSGETVTVTFTPELSEEAQSFVETGTTYYLSVDAWNGEEFALNSNAFTFRSRQPADEVYCGPYSDVPVVKNFGILFELENNETILLNFD